MSSFGVRRWLMIMNVKKHNSINYHDKGEARGAVRVY
jgi:hypothetical protein